MQNEKPNVEAQYKSLLIIWAALLMSQFLLLLVVFFVKPKLFGFDLSGPFGGEEPVLNFALLGIGGLAAVMSFALRSVFVRNAVKSGTPALITSAVIVGVAMCEVATLFGILSAMHNGYPYFFIFFIIGILGVLLHFPQRDDLTAASFKGAQ